MYTYLKLTQRRNKKLLRIHEDVANAAQACSSPLWKSHLSYYRHVPLRCLYKLTGTPIMEVLATWMLKIRINLQRDLDSLLLQSWHKYRCIWHLGTLRWVTSQSDVGTWASETEKQSQYWPRLVVLKVQSAQVHWLHWHKVVCSRERPSVFSWRECELESASDDTKHCNIELTMQHDTIYKPYQCNVENGRLQGREDTYQWRTAKT